MSASKRHWMLLATDLGRGWKRIDYRFSNFFKPVGKGGWGRDHHFEQRDATIAHSRNVETYDGRRGTVFE